MKPIVLQTEHLDPAPAAWLTQRADLRVCRPEEPLFAQHAPLAQALIVRTYTRIDQTLLARLPNLRCVGRAGVGLDNIDLPACAARHVRVVSTPDANTQAVAEYVLCLLCDALRPRVMLDMANPVPTPVTWHALRRDLIAPRQLSELTLGILGFGRIGSRVARVASALGMDVLYHDIRDVPQDQRGAAHCVGLAELCTRSDVLSLHVDPRPANRHFVDEQVLTWCKSSAIIINTSRGMVVDARALATFLRAHPQAQALLDVHEPEPITPDYPLWGLQNAHISPHLAAGTVTAQENMSWVVRDVWRVLSGQEPEHAAV